MWQGFVRVVRGLGRWGSDGGGMNPSIQCSRLKAKIVAARVCLWCLRFQLGFLVRGWSWWLGLAILGFLEVDRMSS